MTLQIAIKLIDTLEFIHTCGYIYNNFEKENVVVSGALSNTIDSVMLVGFGQAQMYRDKEGNTIET